MSSRHLQLIAFYRQPEAQSGPATQQLTPHRSLTCKALVEAHSRFGNTVRSNGENGLAMLDATTYML